ncbi:hypothetical protein K9M74_00670 [Candidatus Woesearchaeota archaeon]|nr:hypothetical protein [Candidatus Woesearchaeota archaeon]
MNRLELPRDEIAFRKEYESLVEHGLLTTIYRPGNRIYPEWRGYKPGELVTARVIQQPGNDALMIPPRFKDIARPVKIKNIQLKSLDELSAQDFMGSSPDVQSVNDLINHLQWIYTKTPAEYNNQVTKIELEYLPLAKEFNFNAVTSSYKSA